MARSGGSNRCRIAAIETLYHITARADWDAARARGLYDGDALATDGFIHCCFERQIDRVAAVWFAGRSDLVVLAIDPARLTAEVRLETAEDGDRFPHVYGPIEIDAVIDAQRLTPA